MTENLVRIHHENYLEDIPFWISHTEGKDPILEVGCGHGRVTIPLLEIGRQVVGVDLDGNVIKYLQNVLAVAPKEMQEGSLILQEDILKFHTEQRFGSVIIPCNTYSTFNHVNRLSLLQNLNQFLDKGGAFLASTPNPVQLNRFHQTLMESPESEEPELEMTFNHPETGNPVQASSRFTATSEVLCWDWIYDHLHPDGQVERQIQSVEHYLASRENYLGELEKFGFGEITCLGDFNGEVYTEESPYLILVASKI